MKSWSVGVKWVITKNKNKKTNPGSKSAKWCVPAELDVGSWLVEGRLASSVGCADSSSDWPSRHASLLVLHREHTITITLPNKLSRSEVNHETLLWVPTLHSQPPPQKRHLHRLPGQLLLVHSNWRWTCWPWELTERPSLTHQRGGSLWIPSLSRQMKGGELLGLTGISTKQTWHDFH